jgi:asparagine synthase (glutamine-hydrolysing)
VSGIAGIVRLDGAPLDPELIAKMTAAMAHRGPDAIEHWQRSHVALGHCMFRTTPESLAEQQPHTNEDASLVLVMDGRVDNRDELRHNLLAQGAILRAQTDAELVLRAYETWGEKSPDRIIGEFVFFIWDSRHQRLFGARDAAGTRHFYYYAGKGWFGFASEIKGLLATRLIEARLNESRVFDYLVSEYDRDDQVGTFYLGINRMPAGHAMSVTPHGIRTWRYWEPGNLPPINFKSLDECAEAFREQFRIAVKCRLRSIGPVGAMLSGGLDSSSIVGLIGKEFRGDLQQPLKTFSLIREDRENCKDWQHIQEMLKEGWIEPTIIDSSIAGDVFRSCLDSIPNADEPFALSNGLTYSLIYEAASQNGCRIVFDGMAGDLLFYSLDRSLDLILRRKMLTQLPEIYAAYGRHGMENRLPTFIWRSLAAIAPEGARTAYRKLRERNAKVADDLTLLQREMASRWLAEKRTRRSDAAIQAMHGSDQSAHARNFTSGLLSFAHEVYGQIAFSKGVEPRSPLSDRRMLEFAIRMPLEAKLAAPWYKNFLRASMADTLPAALTWRQDVGNHPGWRFFERLISGIAKEAPAVWDVSRVERSLGRWVDREQLHRQWRNYEEKTDYEKGYNIFVLAMLAQWLGMRSALS